MLRNYTVTDTKTQADAHSIIINKNLITKPINTANLTTSFSKYIEFGSLTIRNNVEIYKIVIHINNKFNPTNIELFDTKNNFNFYHLSGDSTLHVNMGLLTFFKILSSEAIKVINKNTRKSNNDDEYYIPNSKLSNVIASLVQTEMVTLYTKDENNEIV
jgi:hypothetical protein